MHPYEMTMSCVKHGHGASHGGSHIKQLKQLNYSDSCWDIYYPVYGIVFIMHSTNLFQRETCGRGREDTASEEGWREKRERSQTKMPPTLVSRPGPSLACVFPDERENVNPRRKPSRGVELGCMAYLWSFRGNWEQRAAVPESSDPEPTKRSSNTPQIYALTEVSLPVSSHLPSANCPFSVLVWLLCMRGCTHTASCFLTMRPSTDSGAGWAASQTTHHCNQTVLKRGEGEKKKG